MNHTGFFFDSSACSGCKTCQVACKDKNNLDSGIRFRRVYEIAGARWKETEEGAWDHSVVAYNISLACNHCENPACAKACPTGAMHAREDGIVVTDPERCIGCRYCEWACPYGAPQFNKAKGIMEKCDLCQDYLAEGKKPACVDACPMRVLESGTMGELIAVHGNNRSVYPLPEAVLTGPSLLIKPHSGASRAHELGAAIINREEVKNEF